MQQFPHLFSPITIRKTTFKNRICTAPQKLPDVARGGYIAPRGQAFFEARARGGAGMVCYGETYPQYSTAFDTAELWLKYRTLDLHDRTTLCAYVDAIKRHGAVAAIEFNHRGILSFPSFLGGKDAQGPCEMTSPFGVHVKAMDEDDIEQLCEDFADAAVYVKQRGFDMCMIHGGHGWLLSQFLSPLTNHRTDRFGGSLENRARLSQLLLGRIRQKCGADFLLELRISGDEETAGGLTIEDQIEYAKLIEPYVDILHVSVGTDFAPYNRMFSSYFDPNGLNAPLARRIREAVHVPVSVVGGINDAELAERILAEGCADFVSLGRQLYADPEFPRKAQEGRHREISPCVRCMVCHHADSAPPPFSRCAVNPLASYEYEYHVPPKAERPKKVYVAGGGVAGMKAAVTAAQHGHKVTLFEQNDRLGGILNFTDVDSFKHDLRHFKDHLVYMTELCGVEIRLNTELTPDMIRADEPDAVLCAIGSEGMIPNIPGAELGLHVLEAYARPETLGDHIVMVGGGLAGCESALHFAALGKHVTILELTDQLFRDTAHYPQMWMKARIYHNPAITPMAETTCLEVRPEGVLVRRQGEERLLTADSVVFAVGQKSRPWIKLCEAAPKQFHVIGDARKPGKIREAVHDGFYRAMDL